MKKFKPNNVQMKLLTAVNNGATTISAILGQVDLARKTAWRNLQVLAEKKLVKQVVPGTGKANTYSILAKGKKVVA